MARPRNPAKPASNNAASSHPSPDTEVATQQQLGASLLNNARLGHHRSSPIGVAALNGHGRLKRPRLTAKGGGGAPARRGDVFAIDVSPLKKAHKAQGRVDDAPPKEKKAPQQQQQQSHYVRVAGPSSPGRSQGSTVAEALPSSPPAVAPERRGRFTRRTAKATGPELPKSNAVDAPLTRRSHPEVRVPGRKRRKPETIDVDDLPQRASFTVPAEVENEVPDRGRQRPSSKKQKVGSTTEASGQDPVGSPPNHVPTLPDHGDADKTSSSADEDEGAQPGTIDAVFEFLVRERRSGRCRTAYGSTIRRMCKESHTAIIHDDSSLDTVVESADAIREAIDQMLLEVQEDDRRNVKSDAYAYLFRALISFLEAVFDWLYARHVVVVESLEAMRIVTPFIRGILSLKDTMTRWNVSVPQRFKGDGLIMEVDSHLIVPLRQVYRIYDAQLRQLEDAEMRRQARRKLYRRLREEEEERQRGSEASARRQQRQQRWQDLHIARMQCEPDALRRRRLIITPLEDLEERDANGIRFERVPVFKPRSSPPLHRVGPHFQERIWMDEEASALLEAVQTYAGPKLYENIFRVHCRPGGILRDFTVAEIVDKVSWIRSSWLKMQQEKGWEAPEWVAKLPASP